MKKFTNLLPICALVLFCLSLFSYIQLIQTHPDQWYKFDLQAYYNAGLDVLAGRDVYLTGQTYFNFVYTPFAAMLFSVMVYMPLEIGKFVLTGTSILVLIVVVWISWGLLGYPRSSKRFSLTLITSAVLLWAQPVQETLFHGQINLLLLGIIMLGFSKKDKFWNGIGVGVAAGIKLTPLIFIFYLFFTKRYQATVIASASFVATILLGFLVLPRESISYWSGLFLQTDRIGSILLSGSQSLHATATRFYGITDAAHSYWLISAIMVGIFGVGLAAYAGRRKKELFGLVICGITGLLISPFSWTHHWVWLIFLLPLSVHAAFSKKNPSWWILVVIFGAVLLNGRDFSFEGIPQIKENVYVVFGLLFLLVSAYYLFRNMMKTSKAK